MAVETFKVKFDVDSITDQRTITMPDNDVNFSDATESESGFIEIATQAEVNIGTDHTKAVTPLTLKTLLNTLSLGGGDMIAFSQTNGDGTQSGSYGITCSKITGTIFDYTFDSAQPDINYLVLVEDQDASIYNTHEISNKTTTGFRVVNNGKNDAHTAVRVFRIS